VFRLDTRTGQRDLLTFDNPGDIVGWVVDRKDEVRIAVAYDKNIVKIYYRENQKAPWAKIEEFDNRKYSIEPLAFDFDHRTLYVRSNKDRNKAALFKYDLDKKAIGELVAESDAFDVGGMRFDVAKQKLVGIGTGTGGGVRTLSGVKWLDPDWDRVQKMVDSALPGRSNWLSWGSKVPNRVLVTSTSDTYPGGYILLDTNTNKMERIAESRSWIDPEKMSPMQRVRYAARDGLNIPAMLTLPKSAGGKSAKNLPLVVDIHGGPHAPGAHWGYDETAQFLASRGYAVLQPSFRGSTGFGRSFLEAGYKQWGLAMQDDITDGVLWAIKQGYADPKRVCLMGASYGGYATLYGLIKEQGMFRCGVAAVAVTDLDLLFSVSWSDTYRSDDVQASMRERIGDPKTDAEAFKKVSPLYQADKVSAPVLLFFGSDDRRVPLIHGEKFKAALDAANKPNELIVYTAEGHGFNKLEHQVDYWRRVEAFLGKHLGVGQ
jgi:dipeptidyl aminopeptidase/acylaminoacyl peptidase